MNIGYKLIPIITLAIFVLVMTTGSVLKKPLFGDDDVIHYIDKVRENVQHENWEEASTDLKKAQQAWEKVVFRIQFSAERDEISIFKHNLERTKGYISAQEKGGVLAELSEAKFIWSGLGK